MRLTPFAVAHLGMLLWAVLVGASFFAAAQVNQTVDPVLLTGLRLLLSALIFLPLVLRQQGCRLSLASAAAHCLLGLLLAAYFGALFEALRYTSAVTTGTLFTLVPLLTLGAEALLLQGHGGKGRLPAMVIAALGALLLLLKDGVVGHTTAGAWPSSYAVWVFSGGCLAMALYSPLSQRLKSTVLKDRTPVSMTFWNLLFGSGFLFALCLGSGGWRSAAQLSTTDLLWLGYLALFATLATFWLLHRAIGVIAPSTVISYVYLSTLFLTLYHWLGGQQQPETTQWVGALMVALGMGALIRESRRASATRPSTKR